jgi:hypothetical protein
VSVIATVGILHRQRREDTEDFAQLRAEFDRLARLVVSQGASGYREPEIDGKPWSAQVLPSNGIAYLQRLAIYLWWEEGVPAPGTYEMTDPFQDDVVQEWIDDCLDGELDENQAGQTFNHLVCPPSDTGIWLPIDTDCVVVDGDALHGSSVRLKQQCEYVAEWLRLPLGQRLLAPELMRAVDRPGRGRSRWKRYGIESYNCLLLHKACIRSLKLGAAIVVE